MDRVDRIRAEWRRECPDVGVRPQGVVGRLHRIAAALTEPITAIYREHGLTEGEFDMLCALRRADAPFTRQPLELARTTMITTGGLTKRLDALERKGHIVREAHDRDGRTKIARLTDRRAVDAAFTAHIPNEARLVAHVPNEDIAVLERILRTWQQTLDTERSAT